MALLSLPLYKLPLEIDSRIPSLSRYLRKSSRLASIGTALFGDILFLQLLSKMDIKIGQDLLDRFRISIECFTTS